MPPWCPDCDLSAGFFHRCVKFKEKIILGQLLFLVDCLAQGSAPRGRNSMSQKVRMIPLQLAVWLMTTESGGERAPAFHLPAKR